MLRYWRLKERIFHPKRARNSGEQGERKVYSQALSVDPATGEWVCTTQEGNEATEDWRSSSAPGEVTDR